MVTSLLAALRQLAMRIVLYAKQQESVSNEQRVIVCTQIITDNILKH